MSENIQKSSRRSFFVGAAALTGAVVVASQTPTGQKIVSEVEEVLTPSKKSGYHLSDHVKKYYQTTLV
ncbi:hypothetical protein [Polynucleobacter kasalickyi]|uniref:Formate dehydrogenase region TAT target n=1 Tax=Polynucleobacter kasalickyi TaxID=1938817 RepID=A0A1W1ZPE5_9BURK|nr:hypothetical protein [Polynucleobacter kasalickyi]SMC50415.1 formate dehydrogenase region TAT target [Polynucleobacter kasalickyi]